MFIVPDHHCRVESRHETEAREFWQSRFLARFSGGPSLLSCESITLNSGSSTFTQTAKFMSTEPQGDLSPNDTVTSPAEDTIALDMFLKLANVVQSGGQAKHLIQSGVVLVNGEVEVRRGRKLRPGDSVEINGEQFVIESDGL